MVNPVEGYFQQFEGCRQHQPPFCTDACPLHVDVLDLQEKLSRKSYNAAYRTFRNAAVFPEIVAGLCPEYCAAWCPRQDVDAAVQLNLLERTCVSRATRKEPTDYNVPVKSAKVAIIGSGISGLACALRLAQKKYQVVVLEQAPRWGGRLWQLLPEDVLARELECQFMHESIDWRFGTKVASLEELSGEGLAAVYVATGQNGLDFGLLQANGNGYAMHGDIAVVAGGELAGKELIPALADGLRGAWMIEVFLKTGKLAAPAPGARSTVIANSGKLQERREPAVPGQDGLLDDQGVVAEANRCIRCQCDGCKSYCDVVAYHDKWPLRMRDDILTTVMPSESMLHKTPGVRLINSCTQCKRCDEECPGEIELGNMMRDARYALHRIGKMPGAYHQFWLRDMAFANGNEAALVLKPPSSQNCALAFFPGCQLGAAGPEYVLAPYKQLLKRDADTGLMLRCCGIPAEWAGDEATHQGALDALRADWLEMGKPMLATACPACGRHLAEYLPEIQTISLYEVLDCPDALSGNSAEEYAIFDPCTARNDQDQQRAVRRLAAQAGIVAEELPGGCVHGCCGYGGHIAEADPALRSYITAQRSALRDLPYLVYCINCRDIFRQEGKEASHILEIIFQLDGAQAPLPGLDVRRDNRRRLKRMLAGDAAWTEAVGDAFAGKCSLLITDSLRAKLNQRRILEEDICSVILACQASGRRIINHSRQTYSCYGEIGSITLWVEYRLEGNNYQVINIYTHRLRIELEEIWKGNKTEAFKERAK